MNNCYGDIHIYLYTFQKTAIKRGVIKIKGTVF